MKYINKNKISLNDDVNSKMKNKTSHLKYTNCYTGLHLFTLLKITFVNFCFKDEWFLKTPWSFNCISECCNLIL